MEIKTNNLMKGINIDVEIKVDKQTIWRLKAFMILMRLAAWVGGFSGIEFDYSEDK